MPTNPVSPNTEAAVDRLTLSVDAPRGGGPAAPCGCLCACVEAEASSVLYGQAPGTCFESE